VLLSLLELFFLPIYFATFAVEMNLSKQRDCLGFIQNNESMSFPTSVGKSIQFEDLHSTFPKLVSADISEQSNLFPSTSSCLELEDTRRNKPQELDFQNSFTHAMLQPTKRQKMTEFAFDVSWVNDASSDQSTYEMAQPCSFETLSEVQQQLETIESGMIPSKGSESGMIYSRNSMEINSRPTLGKKLKDIDDDEEDIQGRTGFLQDGVNAKKELIIVHEGEEDIEGRTGFNQDGINDKKEIIESKDDQEKQTKSPNTIVEAVSLIDLFTRDQIEEHITSLRKESVQVSTPPASVFNYLDLFTYDCYDLCHEPTIPKGKAIWLKLMNGASFNHWILCMHVIVKF